LPFSNYHELSSPSSPFHHGHDFRLEGDFVIRASSSNLPLCSCTTKEYVARKIRDPRYRLEGGISGKSDMGVGLKKNIYGAEVQGRRCEYKGGKGGWEGTETSLVVI